jgi:hypothetical protein
VVVGYLVMPDHIYLPSSEAEQGTLSTVMQVLKQRFARQVVRAHCRGVAHPFAGFARVGLPGAAARMATPLL